MEKEFKILHDEQVKIFGNDYIKIITQLLLSVGKKSSGELIKSLDFRIQNTAKEISVVLSANEYFDEVDRGRKAGTYPPIKAISKWATLKGISQDAVFPIAHKIFKFGIKPTNILDKAIKEIENNQALIQKLENISGENLEEIIHEMFKEKK